MVFQEICPPALIYLIFSTTQVIIDTIKGFYNMAMIKLIVTLVITILLNYLCGLGLGVISWIIVFIPFILMTLIVSMLLLMLGLDPTTGKLQMHATDSELDGLGLVDDFVLTLDATLRATDKGLEGEALLGVKVSQPPLLRLIPPRILESTGQSILNGILLGIKARVTHQLIQDFSKWCETS